MDKILEIKNLSVGFNIENELCESEFFYALNNINLTFEKGKIHAIAGESGCGKSVLINTILNLLAKNSEIKSGEIFFRGKNLLKNNFAQKLRGREIFYIPQDPFMSLNPLYTVENQLLELICLKDLEKSQQIEIAKKALKDVKINNIENVLKSYPHELSGGMKQRVIIAMALISNSDLILADEPTTALDVSVSNVILELLLELKKMGKTIILITHDLSIVSNFCDTVTVMYLGDVVEVANCTDLFKNPKHPYTKALLEALPDKKGKKLKNIKGQISPITKPVLGCKFHPRCDFAFDKCTIKKPELSFIESDLVSCWLYSNS